MAIKTEGVITIQDIVDEFGGTSPHSLSEYYRGGDLVPESPTNSNVPTEGEISLSDFYGAVSTVVLTYEMIGGGGAGGQGFNTSGSAASGTSSSIFGSGLALLPAAGGLGGVSRSLWAATDGEGTVYGPGGPAGKTSDRGSQVTAGSNAPSTSYGAGGGGGGGFPFAAYNAGAGGNAGTRRAGTTPVVPGTELTITVGSGGARGSSAGAEGGAGAGGYVEITVNGITKTYSTPGTYTYTV